MRHFLSMFISLTFLLCVFSTTLSGQNLPPPIVAKHTLTVTIEEAGFVESNPPGLNCLALSDTSPQTCNATFVAGKPVALLAGGLSESGGNENYSSTFSNWSGDCNGTTSACAVVMDSNKTVTAKFNTEVVKLPEPQAKTIVSHHPRDFPTLLRNKPSEAKPIGIGEYPDGFELKIGLPSFTHPVDLYFGISIPDSSTIYLLDTTNNVTTVSSGLVPWKTNVNKPIDEVIFGQTIPTNAIPKGKYDFFLMATPTGDTSSYTLWHSYMNILQPGNPLVQ